LAGAVEGNVTAALDLEDLDAVAADEMVRLGVAAERHDRGVLEQEQQVVRQAAVDSGLGERALPLERLGVWDDAGLHDLQQTRRHDPSPIARPSSPAVAPAIDQRLAAVPTTALSTPQAIRPGKPSSRSATAARNPTSNAPPSPAPQARAPSPMARGSRRISVTCPRPGRGNRARLGPPPRTWWGARESPARPLLRCIRSPAPPSARG